MPHQCIGCGHTFEDGSKEMLSGCPECGGNKFQFRPAGAEFPENPEPAELPAEDTPPDSESASSITGTVGRATTRVRDFVSSEEPAEAPSGNADTDAASGPDPDPDATWPSEAGEDSVEREASIERSSPVNPSASGGDGATEAGDDLNVESDDDDLNVEEDGSDIIDADARREKKVDEDLAQTSARTDVVSSEELSVAGTDHAIDGKPGTPSVEGRTDSERDVSADGEDGESTDQRSFNSDRRVLSQPSDEEPDISELREQLNDQFESIKIVEPGQYELNLMELYDREEYIIALQENGRYVIQVPEQWIGDDPGDR